MADIQIWHLQAGSNCVNYHAASMSLTLMKVSHFEGRMMFTLIPQLCTVISYDLHYEHVGHERRFGSYIINLQC